MNAKPHGRHRNSPRQTELRRTSREAARRLEREAAKRERKVFLTAKFDRVWSALTRLRAKVGAARFWDLLIDFPDTLEELRSPDLGAIAEFHDLLGSDHAFLAEVTDAFETISHPGALWAKWIEVVVEQMPGPSSAAPSR